MKLTPLFVQVVVDHDSQVVVDHDSRDTGEWELIYLGSHALRKANMTGRLELQGKRLERMKKAVQPKVMGFLVDGGVKKRK